MDEPEHLESVRQPWTLVIVYTVFYAAIFVVGLVGNVFVVLAVLLNTNLRSVTDYLISSLALADLLIIIFCLPTTLLNNLLTEWQLGSVGCKLSTFINSTTSCASIFTLVAVTADRYVAICHTLKYTLWETRSVVCLIVVIWFVSAVLASPNLVLYDEILYDLMPPNGTLVARLCVSIQDDFLHFIIVNLIIAFLLPVIMICVSYALIFITVTNHQSLAVDARIRDERVKLRVAQMMLTVIVVFMMCWTPLYALYFYFFMASSRQSAFFQLATSVLRPIFQWLSLLSSSLNPLIYIAYSQKYRRAFHQLLLMPCRLRYQSLRRAARATLRLPPLKSDEAAMAASLAASDNFGAGPPTCTGCLSSYASPPPAGGRCRKISLPHHHYYCYHNPANHQNSYGGCASARVVSPPKPRKMSEQSALSGAGRCAAAAVASRHSEAFLMCDPNGASRRSSRQSLGVPALNCIDEARENSLSDSATTKRKLSFQDDNKDNKTPENNKQPDQGDNKKANIDNKDNSNNKDNKNGCVKATGAAIGSPALLIRIEPSSGTPAAGTLPPVPALASDSGTSFLKSPLRFLHGLVQRCAKARPKGGAPPAASGSTRRRGRVISVTPRPRLPKTPSNGCVPRPVEAVGDGREGAETAAEQTRPLLRPPTSEKAPPKPERKSLPLSIPAGSQQIFGPAVSQQMLGPAVSQQIFGPAGSQKMLGPAVSQQIFGPAVSQQMLGPAGSQQMLGPAVSQQIFGPAGSQQMLGPAVSQQIFGPAGSQQMLGPAGDIGFADDEDDPPATVAHINQALRSVGPRDDLLSTSQDRTSTQNHLMDRLSGTEPVNEPNEGSAPKVSDTCGPHTKIITTTTTTAVVPPPKPPRVDVGADAGTFTRRSPLVVRI